MAAMTDDSPHISALRLTCFRNYPEAELTLDARPVALYGANGAGKTNLLEAVSMLAPGRGMRRASVEEIALRSEEAAGSGVKTAELGSTAWSVSADLALPGGVQRVGVGQDPAAPSRKLTRLNGAPAAQNELGALARVTWATPAQDRIFAGPRGERLKFFDRLVLALHPDHGLNASRYEKAMRERSRLLEEGARDPAWLEGLEAEMAARGVALARARAEIVARLQAEIDERPDGAFPKADLTLIEADADRGAASSEVAPFALEDAAAAEQAFAAALAEARRRDGRAGRALTGPHRTDFAARHRVKAMPAGECSTGEQKALLVGLALAHARALGAHRGEGLALLLLDEAAAHLDRARRAALAEELLALGVQVWMSGTDAELFEAFGDRAQRFEVSEGRVEPR
ncbi:MAG: DNA replication/repair protein RecF [Maricaulaceae bacterium]|jgi:DNA replication and repair protein RecF